LKLKTKKAVNLKDLMS